MTVLDKLKRLFSGADPAERVQRELDEESAILTQITDINQKLKNLQKRLVEQRAAAKSLGSDAEAFKTNNAMIEMLGKNAMVLEIRKGKLERRLQKIKNSQAYDIGLELQRGRLKLKKN
ncbi:MAG: hypothetical protein KJ601_03285 [Nanoarchaeota archaeon]|nr:hypothetical protein [Nanoarchaeota archaeon]MBU1704857.1 hypothetical protein [Nanoarchaeota archaeon]